VKTCATTEVREVRVCPQLELLISSLARMAGHGRLFRNRLPRRRLPGVNAGNDELTEPTN
jgi:hypothetical protein